MRYRNIGGKSFAASKVEWIDDKLMIEFAGANVKANYKLLVNEHYIALKLLGVEGGAIPFFSYTNPDALR